MLHQHRVRSVPGLSKFSSPPWTAFLPRCSPPGSPASHPHSSPQHRKHYGPMLNFLGLTFNQLLSQLNPTICGITTHTSSQTGFPAVVINFLLSLTLVAYLLESSVKFPRKHISGFFSSSHLSTCLASLRPYYFTTSFDSLL